MVETRDHVPKAGIGIQIGSAMDVEDADAPAMGQDDSTPLGPAPDVGEAMEDASSVSFFPGIGGRGHGSDHRLVEGDMVTILGSKPDALQFA
jgi:hypothetical protein